jgi:acetylornithine/N-succinyldiaminopimelate aminotransferase
VTASNAATAPASAPAPTVQRGDGSRAGNEKSPNEKSSNEQSSNEQSSNEQSSNEQWRQRWQGSVMDTYGTPPLALVRGQGAHVVDADGRRYLDMVAGIAVNALGHAHPAVIEAVTRQVATLGHTSNLVINPRAVELAERLLALAGRDGRVFFCNSGAEANEAALKIARRTGRSGFVTAQGSFHGRTTGALALTGQPGKREPFAPLLGEVSYVPYGDAAALRAQVGPQTSAVLLEPVQGEGGVVPAPDGYLAGAQAVARAAGALFVLDEVQTGIGRTGSWFAYQQDGLEPDVVTLAKGLGGGLPIGAVLAFGAAASLLTTGQHGSTFGGNPISCATALAVLDTIEADGLLARARDLGQHLSTSMTALGHPLLRGVRGRGLLQALLLARPLAAAVERAMRERGVLVNAIAPDLVRIAPPLVLTDADAETFMAALPLALDAAVAAAGPGQGSL